MIFMKEVIEFRISNKYAHLLLNANQVKNNSSNTVIEVAKDDPMFEKIRILNRQVKEKYNDSFFLYSNIKRQYSEEELESSALLHIKIKTAFEPTGEEYGTIYEETEACEICGANRKQVGPLKLKRDSIPKKDISRTIAGEVVVSENFFSSIEQRGLKGLSLERVFYVNGISNYYQLIPSSSELALSQDTVAGVNVFDMSESNEAIEFVLSEKYTVKLEREVYKCPKGHTIGLNLLSEPYVLKSASIDEYDFFASRQKTGVKRGVLRPEPIYFCSQAFRKMVTKEKLSGFDFEIAHIV
jgi:hypothetical protein